MVLKIKCETADSAECHHTVVLNNITVSLSAIQFWYDTYHLTATFKKINRSTIIKSY